MKTTTCKIGASYPGFGIEAGDSVEFVAWTGGNNVDPSSIYVIEVDGVLSLLKIRRDDNCFVFTEDDGSSDIFPIESLAHFRILGVVVGTPQHVDAPTNVVSLLRERRLRRLRG